MTTTRNRIGEYTNALLQTLEDGPMTREQLRDYNLMPSRHLRHYLRRCEFRGLLTVDRDGRSEVYTVSSTWREFLAVPGAAAKKKRKPGPVSAVDLARATQPSSVFHMR
ncbi:MAG: hypothetical protein KA195_00270 [Burkholderiaceae bacterium]|nr:hypothetical protein [Burkholderiaceae bacterium]